MHSRSRISIAILISVAAAGCAPAPSTWDLAQQAVSAMGGAQAVQNIETLTMTGGEGTRNRLGQLFDESSPDQAGTLANVDTTLDFTVGRAALEYDITMSSGFMQHRTEVFTRHDGRPVGYSINNNGRMASSPGGLFSWGPQNSPTRLLHRNPVAILLDAARPNSGANPVEEVEFNGSSRLHSTFTASWGEEIGLYFDPDSGLLVGFETLDTEPMLGDVQARYVLGDYQQSAGVLLPHRITVTKEDAPFSDVRYDTIEINSPDATAIFTIPEDLLMEAERAAQEENYVPIAWNEVANGVYHAVAYSHHSMVVEFPTFVAVVEAPYTETQSLALAALIGEQIPGKSIRYAAITHPHWDHTGGVRGMASLGATILIASGHESQLRPVLDRPHTNPPDALQRAREAGTAGSIETYEDRWTVTDGPQSLELYAVSGSPHADPYVLAYVPAARVLFESDLFNPGSGAAGTPASAHLQTAIRELGLNVATIVGGHGGTGPFSELAAANRSN